MKHNQSIDFVSIVIPVYNEEATLPELLRRTLTAANSMNKHFELILIDDGSRDKSAELIEAAAAEQDSHVVGIILNRNYGQHSAIMAGFEHVRGDLIITLDADLQNPPEEIPNLVAKAEEGFDSVGTVRRNRQDSRLRRYPSKLINKLVKRSTGVEMNDYGCMLRAYRRHVVDAMLECHERSTFIPILANGFARNTAEIDVHHDERAAGESKYSFLSLINLMFDLLTSMTTAPLRMLSIVGGGIAAIGLLLATFLMILRVIYGAAWGVDGVFPLFSVLFIFIGAQFVGLGLLGEYIGRIYSDVRARPRYYVQDILVGEATKDARESDENK
ncbi:undecaprenyl-phosphate 4-deoxy-4-formamido-L-arabinose transferase [Shewanella intestini]|uniref:Undecaprenyl-phosphate 4-deoxy-4-formamido-L-arabinose transferase n=1 Tax=Shewanella intestini TaxID=2017544 RepID=A0ABS5I472_9GAMM|nr:MULTISPECIES: undecaprenyl-phosphate 4-deoxy-4-formamido-L-arabinose transferase [Shewanella]MBR9728822.1 undecaprenyl-phosphate 4-deoxy-4-formamido-L-arabinose transferase [Shewanella intestini]MRG37112.1 undecaprenyl-phosphate 4-deoxy-4-formamido-L-arabinose transferase [Shewanella sp. XMDDZSB0408]